MTISRPAPDQREIDTTPVGPPPLGNKGLPYAFVALCLLLFIPLGVKGMTYAIIAGAMIVLATLLFVLGMEKFGTCVIWLAMFTAPMTAVVLPGASIVTAADFCCVVGFSLLFPIIVRKHLWVPWQFGVGSLVFFTLGMIVSFRVPVPFASIDLNLRVTAATILMPLAFAWWAPRGRKLFWIVAAYPLGQCFNVVYAVLQGPTLGNGRYKGLTEQPTAFGYASLLALCVIPFLMVSVQRKYRWMAGPAALILIYGIWISGSRASLLVLAILVVLYPLLERSLKAAYVVAFLGVIGMAMFQRILDQNGGSNALARLFGGSGSGGSDEARIDGLMDAFHVFEKHPIFGAGYEFDTFLAHNIYMQVLTCVGVVGFVAFMLILWAFAIPLFTGRQPYRLLAYPAVAYIVVGPITPNLGSRYVGIMLAVSLIGATIGRMGPDDVLEDDEPPPEPEPRHSARLRRIT